MTLTVPARVAAGAGLAAGLLLGWTLWHPRPPAPEPPAVAVRNTDSSLTLARAPDATAKPTHVTPRGTLERIEHITVRPNPVVDTVFVPAPAASPTDTVPAPKPTVRVDTVQGPDLDVELSLVRLGDGSRRVTASVRGGKVLGGVDIPVEAAKPPAGPLRWRAGVTYAPGPATYGAFVERDVGPFALLGAVERPDQLTPWIGRIGVGIRW